MHDGWVSIMFRPASMVLCCLHWVWMSWKSLFVVVVSNADLFCVCFWFNRQCASDRCESSRFQQENVAFELAPTRERGGHCRIEQSVYLFRVKCQMDNVDNVVVAWLVVVWSTTRNTGEGEERERERRARGREKKSAHDKFSINWNKHFTHKSSTGYLKQNLR